MSPDKTILPVVRGHCDDAMRSLSQAIEAFRSAGWPENAHELDRTRRHLLVWVQPGGWLDCLERPAPPLAPEELAAADLAREAAHGG